MTGPHDFTFVSGLAFLPVPATLWVLWPHVFSLVSHLYPTVSTRLWVLCFGRMYFLLSTICLPLVSHCVQCLRCARRMILHLSPTCLPLSPLACGCFGRMFFHLSPTFSSPLWVLSHLSPACAPLSPVSCGCFGRMILCLSRICLPLSPVRCGRFGRMIFHLSPTCLPLVSNVSSRMILHMSPTCLPLSPVPCGCSPIYLPLVPRVLWLHDFTLVSHMSPTCASRVLWPHDFYTCPLFLLPPVRCGCFGRIFLHLSPAMIWCLTPTLPRPIR